MIATISKRTADMCPALKAVPIQRAPSSALFIRTRLSIAVTWSTSTACRMPKNTITGARKNTKSIRGTNEARLTAVLKTFPQVILPNEPQSSLNETIPLQPNKKLTEGLPSEMSRSDNGETVARVSLSLPPQLLDRFDRVSKESGFKDRSKA